MRYANEYNSAFLIYASFCYAMFFYVWFLIPETKGLSLEKMDDLFGVTELVQKRMDEDREGHGSRDSPARELGIDGKEIATEERREVAPEKN